MPKTLHVTRDFIVKAMVSAGVKGKLRERADQIARRAAAIAASEGVDGDVRVIDGTRPRGRPYSSVHFDNVDQEYGTSKTARSRVLGRSARG